MFARLGKVGRALGQDGESSSALKFGLSHRTVKQYQHPVFKVDLSKSSKPGHCVVCHNFNPQGHEDTQIDGDDIHLSFFFHVSELRSECVYCSLIRQIRTQFAPQPRKPPSMEDLVSLYLRNSKPVDLGFRRNMPGDRKWKTEMVTVTAISLYVDQPVRSRVSSGLDRLRSLLTSSLSWNRLKLCHMLEAWEIYRQDRILRSAIASLKQSSKIAYHLTLCVRPQKKASYHIVSFTWEKKATIKSNWSARLRAKKKGRHLTQHSVIVGESISPSRPFGRT